MDNKVISNRRAQQKDRHSFSSFEYEYEVNLNPSTKVGRTLSEILKATQNKQMEMKDFMSGFTVAVNKHRNEWGQIQIDETIEMFNTVFTQFMAFIAFIDTHTTLHIRTKELYSNAHTFYIAQQAKPKNKQIKAGEKEERTIIIKFKVQSRELKRKQVAENKQQNEYIEGFYADILASFSNKVRILKGKSSTYYIAYLKKSLGRGGFGEVYKGESVSWNREGELEREDWAIKMCKKGISEYKEAGYSICQEREHEMLTQIHSLVRKKGLRAGQYIIGCKEVIAQSDKKYIIYEYCQHNSIKEYTKKTALNIKNIYEIAYQLIQTLKLIHYDLIETEDDFYRFSLKFDNDTEVIDDINNFKRVFNPQTIQKGIIHRDLKLNNILLKQVSSQHIKIKVIDWAFSKRTYTEEKMNKIHCGTFQYQAPEIEAKIRYSSKVDIWAFGASMFELLTNRSFVEKTKYDPAIKKNYAKQIQEMHFMSSFELSEQGKKFWRGLLLKSLVFQPEDRSSAQQLHQYMESHSLYRVYTSVDTIKEALTLKEVKDALIYNLGVSEAQLSTKSKVFKKAFYDYAALLAEQVQLLIDKKIDSIINLQQSIIERLRYNLQSQKKLFNSHMCKKAISFLASNFNDVSQLITRIGSILEQEMMVV